MRLLPRLRALTLGIAGSVLLTAVGLHLGATIGSLSYPALVQALARGMLERDPRGAMAVLYLWCSLPAVFIAVPVAALSRRARGGFEPSDLLRAMVRGYLAGVCFTLLTMSVYYGLLLQWMPRLEEFASTPSVLGILSDWLTLSNAILGGLLYVVLRGSPPPPPPLEEEFSDGSGDGP